jgi:hypothetical protein
MDKVKIYEIVHSGNIYAYYYYWEDYLKYVRSVYDCIHSFILSNYEIYKNYNTIKYPLKYVFWYYQGPKEKVMKKGLSIKIKNIYV